MSLLAGFLFFGFSLWGLWQFSKSHGKLLGAGILLCLLLQLGFILTYNIPDFADYFLGIHVLLYPFFLFAAMRGIDLLEKRDSDSSTLRLNRLAVPISLLLPLAIALNYRAAFPLYAEAEKTWSENFWNAIPDNATVLTAGDIDIYTFWYRRFALGTEKEITAAGGNFIRFPWFRFSLSPGDPKREAICFTEGSPGSLREYMDNLSRCFLDPLLEHGPVYTTITMPQELEILNRRYRLTHVTTLLTREEMDLLTLRELPLLVPPILYRIEKKE